MKESHVYLLLSQLWLIAMFFLEGLPKILASVASFGYLFLYILWLIAENKSDS
jgi:hypothetical protein